ncbi:MAG: DNA polymerase III subunit gamma/tau [Planctomycetes bacterium]|nr:DNA polymerase III subunit gamma/tau [Planctomycetota bacterium]
MSYEVFTLKYRPRSFGDVVGQQAVAETLKKAVQSGRVANAYLFCGSRGVGKTSMARILAKALNCPEVRDGEPCNRCEICRSISRGEDIDVIEIDGASNRGIDDVRGIRDGAGYVPSRGRYKLYIIDEVHMLTIQAFNALLKVLEEPPAHVKFVFATTDPNNLPDTILSRCQRHEFRRIGVEDIVDRLARIADLEGVRAPREVLETIARKAEGGLRDSVSLLDQVISYAGDEIAAGDLEQAIGVLPREHLESLARAIAAEDLPGVLGALERAFWSGHDPQELLAALTAFLRDFLVWQADPDGRDRDRRAAFFGELEEQMPLDRLLYLGKLFVNLRGDIKRSGHERIQLELACLKAARSRHLLPLEEILQRLGAGIAPAARAPAPAPAAAARPAPPVPPRAPVERPIAAPRPRPVSPGPEPTGSGDQGQAAAPQLEPRPEPAPARRPEPPRAEVQVAPEPSPPAVAPAAEVRLDLAAVRSGWRRVLEVVREGSTVLAGALAQARPRALDGRRLTLAVPAANRFLGRQLGEATARAGIGRGLEAVFGQSLELTIIEEEGAAEGQPRKQVQDDVAVRKFLESFDGGILDVERDDG